MRSNFKLLPLLCLFFFTALSSASLLFQPSTSRHTQKRALLDTHNAAELTNAKRLAAGLPPLPPRSRTDTAKRSGVSLVPISGKIQVTDTYGSIRGYVAFDPASGRLKAVPIDSADTFSFAVSPGGVNNQINLKDSAAPADYPYVAGFLPYTSSELLPGYYVLADLGLSSATPAGSTPQDAGPASSSGQHESAIWNYDSSNGNISAQWVNHDGSLPATTIMYNPGDRALHITGDPTQIQRYNAFGIYVVTFKLV